jgi:hypothetical protein
MSEWQTIETAPRDGTPILVVACDRYAVMYFCTEPYGSQYWCLGNHGGMQLVANDKITHWMPLPEPPK